MVSRFPNCLADGLFKKGGEQRLEAVAINEYRNVRDCPRIELRVAWSSGRNEKGTKCHLCSKTPDREDVTTQQSTPQDTRQG